MCRFAIKQKDMKYISSLRSITKTLDLRCNCHAVEAAVFGPNLMLALACV
jgi:hypothetical protein